MERSEEDESTGSESSRNPMVSAEDKLMIDMIQESLDVQSDDSPQPRRLNAQSDDSPQPRRLNAQSDDSPQPRIAHSSNQNFPAQGVQEENHNYTRANPNRQVLGNEPVQVSRIGDMVLLRDKDAEVLVTIKEYQIAEALAELSNKYWEDKGLPHPDYASVTYNLPRETNTIAGPEPVQVKFEQETSESSRQDDEKDDVLSSTARGGTDIVSESLFRALHGDEPMSGENDGQESAELEQGMSMISGITEPLRQTELVPMSEKEKRVQVWLEILKKSTGPQDQNRFQHADSKRVKRTSSELRDLGNWQNSIKELNSVKRSTGLPPPASPPTEVNSRKEFNFVPPLPSPLPSTPIPYLNAHFLQSQNNVGGFPVQNTASTSTVLTSATMAQPQISSNGSSRFIAPLRQIQPRPAQLPPILHLPNGQLIRMPGSSGNTRMIRPPSPRPQILFNTRMSLSRVKAISRSPILQQFMASSSFGHSSNVIRPIFTRPPTSMVNNNSFLIRPNPASQQQGWSHPATLQSQFQQVNDLARQQFNSNMPNFGQREEPMRCATADPIRRSAVEGQRTSSFLSQYLPASQQQGWSHPATLQSQFQQVNDLARQQFNSNMPNFGQREEPMRCATADPIARSAVEGQRTRSVITFQPSRPASVMTGTTLQTMQSQVDMNNVIMARTHNAVSNQPQYNIPGRNSENIITFYRDTSDGRPIMSSSRRMSQGSAVPDGSGEKIPCTDPNCSEGIAHNPVQSSTLENILRAGPATKLQFKDFQQPIRVVENPNYVQQEQQQPSTRVGALQQPPIQLAQQPKYRAQNERLVTHIEHRQAQMLLQQQQQQSSPQPQYYRAQNGQVVSQDGRQLQVVAQRGPVRLAQMQTYRAQNEQFIAHNQQEAQMLAQQQQLKSAQEQNLRLQNARLAAHDEQILPQQRPVSLAQLQNYLAQHNQTINHREQEKQGQMLVQQQQPQSTQQNSRANGQLATHNEVRTLMQHQQQLQTQSAQQQSPTQPPKNDAPILTKHLSRPRQPVRLPLHSRQPEDPHLEAQKLIQAARQQLKQVESRTAPFKPPEKGRGLMDFLDIEKIIKEGLLRKSESPHLIQPVQSPPPQFCNQHRRNNSSSPEIIETTPRTKDQGSQQAPEVIVLDSEEEEQEPRTRRNNENTLDEPANVLRCSQLNNNNNDGNRNLVPVSAGRPNSNNHSNRQRRSPLPIDDLPPPPVPLQPPLIPRVDRQFIINRSRNRRGNSNPCPPPSQRPPTPTPSPQSFFDIPPNLRLPVIHHNNGVIMTDHTSPGVSSGSGNGINDQFDDNAGRRENEERPRERMMDGVLDLRKSNLPGKPCVWCGKHSAFCNATENGIGTEFCSEVCFDQFRRDSFKKRATCIWCNNNNNSNSNNNNNGSGHGQLNINLTTSLDESKFCSESCLAQFKVKLFCEETSAHLDQIKRGKTMIPGVEPFPSTNNISSSNGNTSNGLDLITPDLWLKKLPNGFNSNTNEQKSPTSSLSSIESTNDFNNKIPFSSSSPLCSPPSASISSSARGVGAMSSSSALSRRQTSRHSGLDVGKASLESFAPAPANRNYLNSIKRVKVSSSPPLSSPTRSKRAKTIPQHIAPQNSIDFASSKSNPPSIHTSTTGNQNRVQSNISNNSRVRKNHYQHSIDQIQNCSSLSCSSSSLPNFPNFKPKKSLHEISHLVHHGNTEEGGSVSPPPTPEISHEIVISDLAQGTSERRLFFPASSPPRDFKFIPPLTETPRNRPPLERHAPVSPSPIIYPPHHYLHPMSRTPSLFGQNLFEALHPKAVVFLPYPVPFPIPLPIFLKSENNIRSAFTAPHASAAAATINDVGKNINNKNDKSGDDDEKGESVNNSRKKSRVLDSLDDID